MPAPMLSTENTVAGLVMEVSSFFLPPTYFLNDLSSTDAVLNHYSH